MLTNYSDFSKDSDIVASAYIFSAGETSDVKEETVIEEDTVVDDTKMGYVDCDKLYLRTEASSDSEPITVLEKDEELMIVSEDDPDWYEVYTASGQDGFCMKNFIRVE